MKQFSIECTDFPDALIAWFKVHGRKLPWRATRDPYAILVSELMLQQTQVSTVLFYFDRWMQLFPSTESLARATENEVLRAWQGLGYYARARNLHRAAQVIFWELKNRFPDSIAELKRLPGVGEYTAGAVLSFAFDRPAPIVDANIARVISRIEDIRENIDRSTGRKTIWGVAARYARHGAPRLSNSALMELGALICLPRNPLCKLCPVRSYCRTPDPESLPVRNNRPAVTHVIENYYLALDQNRLLLQMNLGRRWRGLWTLPRLSETPPDGPVASLTHPVTRFVVHLNLYKIAVPAELLPSHEWHFIKDLHSVPIASPHRRVLEMVGPLQASLRAGG
ncbi:MAG: A/G-specific adenine glycosylase [Verrucomicrobia bacterium]|nr:A/G-specific adenine glycosylase [Verrucomicrobiota bacterium]